jgi:serine/threonine protein kinase
MTDTSGSASGGSAAHTVGTRVGEYELVHDLGAKAGTHAFLARSKGANGIIRVVMLEIAADALVQHAGGVDSVKDSAQNATKVKSLNVVSPLDVKDDGGLAVVSDTVDGATLQDLLDAAHTAGEKLSLDVALRIVVDSLAGLNAAHQNKPNAIVHGGLTPAELIVASEGTTKVTDFALAVWRE